MSKNELVHENAVTGVHGSWWLPDGVIGSYVESDKVAGRGGGASLRQGRRSTNPVPRALFPGFGGGSPTSKARENHPGDEVGAQKGR